MRRARMSGREYERFDDREIFERDRWKCAICRKRIDPSLKWPNPMAATIDHTVPVSEGGAHTRANTRAAHFGCNCRRHNKGGGEQLALIG